MIFQDRTYLREKPDAFPSVSSSEIGSVNQFPPEKPRRHLQVPVNRTFICGRMSRPYGAVSQSVASLSGGSEYWPLNEKSQQKRCHLALYPVRRTETKAMHFIRQQVSRQRCFFVPCLASIQMHCGVQADRESHVEDRLEVLAKISVCKSA